ncbi:MAG: motility protein A [Bacillota bacterium]|nr:motility protein A [Bacillota bacterium]
MNFSVLIGLAAGVGLIVYGITDGGLLSSFIDFPSMAITFGGAFASTFIAFPGSFFRNIPKHLKIVMGKKKYNPQKYIAIIVDFAQEARRKGLLSLEEKASNVDDIFLKDSIMLIVDAIDPEKVKGILENKLSCLEERHSAGWQFYEKASTFAPAFGMIGTLIGLINMLANLNMSSDEGSAKLANGMAVALITTFYGSFLANLLLIPMGNRLHMLHNEEMLCKQIVVEGVIAIQAGENPKHIEERLNGYLCEKQRAASKKESSPRDSGPGLNKGRGK